MSLLFCYLLLITPQQPGHRFLPCDLHSIPTPTPSLLLLLGPQASPWPIGPTDRSALTAPHRPLC